MNQIKTNFHVNERFRKPNEQSQVYLNFAMARNRTFKNVFDKSLTGAIVFYSPSTGVSLCALLLSQFHNVGFIRHSPNKFGAALIRTTF